MKLETDTSIATEDSGNLGGSAVYTFAATAKAFDALSSGLYKDSVRAVLRELGTNAADSHIQAGKRMVPFIVHLPTKMEPWLSVQDRGVGLNDRDIRGFYHCSKCGYEGTADAKFTEFTKKKAPLCQCGEEIEFTHGMYTIYFASNKTHSNDTTGCLGLGSKSPFAYTDSFTMTAIKGGMKRVYTCFKSNGMPGINLMNEQETNEPNGVEIKMAVKPEDFSDFREKAIEVYRWFEPRPIVAGVSATDFEDANHYTATLSTGNWTFYDRNQFSVLMGNVRYKINFSTLDTSFKERLSKAETDLANHMGPLIKAEIGEFDIAISRESLKYTDRTYQALHRRLKQIIKECTVIVKEKIAQCENLWKARIALREMEGNHWFTNLQINKQNLQWRGVAVTSFVSIVGAADCKRHMILMPRWTGARGTFSVNPAGSIPAAANTEIFINDVPTGWNIRIEAYLRTLPAVEGTSRRHRYSLENAKGHMVYLLTELKDQPGQLAAFLQKEQLTGVVRNVSELPEPPSMRKQIFRPKTAKLLHLNCNFNMPTMAWKDAEVDLNDEHVYVEVRGYQWRAGTFSSQTNNAYTENTEDTEAFRDPAWLKERWEKITAFINYKTARTADPDIMLEQIVGVRSAMLDKVIRLKNWKRLDVWLHERCMADELARLNVAKMHLWRSLNSCLRQRISELPGTNKLKPKSPLRLLSELYSDLDAVNHSIHIAASTACDYMNIPRTNISKIKAQAEMLERVVLKRYPLLASLESWTPEKKEYEAIIEYAQIMDNRPGRKLLIQPAPTPASV